MINYASPNLSKFFESEDFDIASVAMPVPDGLENQETDTLVTNLAILCFKEDVYKRQVYNGAEDKSMLDTDVVVHTDGKTEVVPAGTKICLKPGQSITITPYMYHDFIVPETGGSVLLGEVSMCNDDENDNCFYEPIGRFPEIEEDEKPYRLLCTEYPKAR